MRSRSRLLLAANLLLISPPTQADDALKADADVRPLIVTTTSTLPTSGGRIRQYAFDGSADTFFVSDRNPTAADSFTLAFDRPVVVRSVKVETGRPDGTDKLDSGVVERSSDGMAFDNPAKITDEPVILGTQPIRALRIKPSSDLTHPLVIRELVLNAEPAVVPFRYPVEYTINVDSAPEIREWTEKVARLCEGWYSPIGTYFASEGYKPPTRVTITMDKDYKGVAEASGGRIRGSVKFFKDHPDDLGAFIHETVHIIQRYRGRGNPGWLVEGVADYYRFWIYEPGKAGRVNARRAHYNDSYRTTGAFLAFVTEKYNKDLVPKFNTLMRQESYTETAIKDLTGKTFAELETEWLESLKR